MDPGACVSRGCVSVVCAKVTGTAEVHKYSLVLSFAKLLPVMLLLLYKAFVYGECEAQYSCKIHPRGSHVVLIRTNNVNEWGRLWLSQ